MAQKPPGSNNEDGAAPPTSPTESLTIASEADAFALLQSALQSELADQAYVLEFQDWPVLTLRFTGEGYESTITPAIAEALVELQRAMNRSFARVVHHAGNANTLTKQERHAIEFKAKVDEGSSLITVDLGEYAQALSSAMVGKMNGTELVILVLGLAISAGSGLAYKAFLAARSQDKKVDNETQRLVQMSTQETRRLEIFSNALTGHPALKASHEDFEGVRHEVLRSVGDADSLDIQGVTLSQDQARVIAITPRAQAEEIQLNGNYRITKLDWTKEDEVRISLYGVGAQAREFVASMRAHNLTPQNIEKLKACEWDRKLVYLSINATVLRGEVTTATIVDVEWPKAEEPGEGGTAVAAP